MASRPSKRIKLDSTILLSHSSTTTRLLSRLSKPSLLSVALAWLKELHPVAHRDKRARREQEQDSDESEEEEDDAEEGSLRSVYERMRDDAVIRKARVVKQIEGDWKDGLTYRQLAQLDVQYFKDKPTSRSWTAYQLIPSISTPSYPTPAQLLTRLRTALTPYHSHHLYLDPSPQLLTLRLQLLPSTPLTPLPPALLILVLPSTPYILLPPLSASLSPILLQCLCSALSTPPASQAKELQLKGRDWRGLREMLLEMMSSGGMSKWRNGRGEGGGPLVPEGRRVVVDDSKGEAYIQGKAGKDIQRDDEQLQKERDQEVGEIFGREDLPVLERLDYEVHLPYPHPNPDEPSPPFLMRFEGTHVLQGLKAMVEQGFADDGLPEWLGQIAKEGRNALQVGRPTEV